MRRRSLLVSEGQAGNFWLGLESWKVSTTRRQRGYMSGGHVPLNHAKILPPPRSFQLYLLTKFTSCQLAREKYSSITGGQWKVHLELSGITLIKEAVLDFCTEYVLTISGILYPSKSHVLIYMPILLLNGSFIIKYRRKTPCTL